MTDNGGVPLDQKVREAAKPTAGEVNTTTNEPDVKRLMQQVLAYLHSEAGKDNIQSLSCVFVDKSGIPQHAFCVKPNAAAVLLGGVLIAEDQIKVALNQSMTEHREKLIREAEAEAARVTSAGNA